MKKVSLVVGAMLAASLSAPVSAGQYVITTNEARDDNGTRLQQWLPQLKIKRRMADRRRWVINLPDDREYPLLETLQRLGLVKSIEPDIRVTTQVVPNDVSLSDQWGLFSDAAGINALDAWDIADGTGAVIAVADTGYVPHPDLDANRLQGYDMISSSSAARDGNGRDTNGIDEGDYTTFWTCGYSSNSSWHGSHVAGIANAVTDNGVGISGVAPGAKFVPVRVLGSCGGSLSDIADGVMWSAGLQVGNAPINENPADVINLSLGGTGSCTSFMQDAIDAATAAGSVVVVAAGNENTNASSSTPANCNNVITVASIGVDGARASYSNYGDIVDIAAPGGGNGAGILSTIDTGSKGREGAGYAEYQGTSMATPQVAGVIALMRSADPSLTPAQISDILIETVRPFPGECNGCGAGIVDAYAALGLITGADPIDPDPTDPVDPEPTAPIFESINYGGALNVSLNDARRYFWFFTREGVTQIPLVVSNLGENSSVSVTINHNNHNELSVTLTAADGSQTAMSRTSVSGATGQYTASPNSAVGSYVLTVVDRSVGNRGNLNFFRLTQDEEQ